MAAAAGMAAERRWGAGAQRTARTLLAAMLYGLLPFVLFTNVAVLEITADVGLGIGLAWAALAVCGTAAWAVSTRVLRLGRPQAGAVILATIQANTGYLGFPLTAAVLGTDDLAEAAAYDALVTNPTLLIAGAAVAAAFGTKAGKTFARRARTFFARNPPLLAALAGLLAPASLTPDWALDASHVAVILLLPAGFFAVGVTLQSEADAGVLRFPPSLRPPVAAAIALRMLAMPLLLLALSAPLIDLPAPYLLLAAMPCGINALVLAHAYGLDAGITAEAIAWSTALAAAGAAVLALAA